MEPARYRTKSFLIATREGSRVYPTAEEIPPDLRRPLEKALDSELTTTILIANEHGRAEALRRMRDVIINARQPEFPYARQAVLLGLLAFVVWTLATLR